MFQSVISYTVGIRRRFLPIFKTYSVTGHDTDVTGNERRLWLNLADGSQMSMDVTRRTIKVYPDYRNAEIQLNKLRTPPQQPMPPVAVDDGTFDTLLRQRQESAAR